MRTRNAHISLIRQGDLVLHDNKVQTVCGKDLHKDPCMGHTLFGDSYRLGYKPVKLITRLEEPL